jgi:hypothetical protein
MNKAPYIKNMHPAERAELMKVGAALKLAHLQLPADQADLLVKRAISPGGALDATAKTVVVGSLLTGIPIGIMAHMISKKVTDVKRQERELQQKIDYYREAGQGIETGLSQAGVTA